MPAIATATLTLAVLAATVGLFLFTTAWSCRDEVALLLGRTLATAGQIFGIFGFGAWIGSHGQVSHAAAGLLVIAGVTAFTSIVTRAKPTRPIPQAPRPV